MIPSLFKNSNESQISPKTISTCRLKTIELKIAPQNQRNYCRAKNLDRENVYN